MAKKSHRQKTNKSRKKTIGYHLRVYFLSIFAGVAVFIAGNYFFNSQPICANSKTCTTDLSFSIDNDATGIFQGRTIIPPKINLALDNSNLSILGADTPSGEKHIYVDLSNQTIYAFQGKTQIMKTLISSGKWGKTPVGNFNIWTKLRSTRMAGGVGADAYSLPNVPYVMYFFHDFGFHGAYWHNNFGHPMSHGCVNMRIVDARDLFNWADGPSGSQKGTPVSVCNSLTEDGNCVQKNPVN
ncbi:MAG: hypothetical protein COX79_01300 [Candidatus Levybacteria bacterium CG_4_10_14_0_2_um_filter_36_16]|nr:MAG: hypothetical protein AUK12_02875 [Candidatus Levybacteria bacterium CG2_30_37_29]PIZ97670.1 MAG: hypothetical protein COX79_01300 [Candidatus Levybacteria bacterium CG_4_10_14_0_2_um_filter_36_16]